MHKFSEFSENSTSSAVGQTCQVGDVEDLSNRFGFPLYSPYWGLSQYLMASFL
jgi:hypothetical protein